MTFSRLIAVFAFFAMLIGAPVAVQAQSADGQFLESLSEINRIDPVQRKGYESAAQTLDKRVLDNKNKVVGEVNDVVLGDNGEIESLYVDFDRLHLDSPVYISYRQMNINSVSNGYAMAFNDKQIQDIYPELLAGIETAAGEDAGNVSVRNVIGATVKTKDGRKIAEVEDVMFSTGGGRAEVLYLALAYSVMRGKKLGVPYSSMEYRPTPGGKAEIIATNEQADAIAAFVKSK